VAAHAAAVGAGVNASFPPAPSPWSPRQRRWLQALGHTGLRVGGDEEEAPLAADAGRQADLDTRHAAMSPPAKEGGPFASAPPAARRAPPAPTVNGTIEETSAQPAVARGSAQRPARLPDRLHLALLRASGLDPADPATQAVMAQWPVDRLRGDGAAKRAFWPQLRALRRRPS